MIATRSQYSRSRSLTEQGIPASHIEKDSWVTEVLRGAATMATARNLEIVFKGGTSLSKAFGLVERFSEDIDLLVVIPGSLGTGAADSKLKALVGGAATATGLTAETVANATSKGVKRGARCGGTRASPPETPQRPAPRPELPAP